MTEAEIRATYLQATEHQGLPAAPEAKSEMSPSDLPGGTKPC